jgi:predicted transcriptional regulator
MDGISLHHLAAYRISVKNWRWHLMSSENPKNLDKVFKALGHNTRRRILRLLAQSPRYPYELSKLLALNRRVVLKHLDALQKAGLVTREHGESDLGPDRIYYKLKVSIGLSTTIMPEVFAVRIYEDAQTRRTTAGFKIPKARHDVKAVKQLLHELGRVNNRLKKLDNERMRFASIRGQIMKHIEMIMERCDWDPKSCQQVRSLINPVRISKEMQHSRKPLTWEETVEEALLLFDKLFKTIEKEDSTEESVEESSNEGFLVDVD